MGDFIFLKFSRGELGRFLAACARGGLGVSLGRVAAGPDPDDAPTHHALVCARSLAEELPRAAV
jgi:hypothetical protein